MQKVDELRMADRLNWTDVSKLRKKLHDFFLSYLVITMSETVVRLTTFVESFHEVVRSLQRLQRKILFV